MRPLKVKRVLHNGESVIDVADRIRDEQKNPRFDQGEFYSPAYWASRFGYMVSEWTAYSEDDRVERIAAAIIEDAMELIANNKDKIQPRFTPMVIDKDAEDFLNKLGR